MKMTHESARSAVSCEWESLDEWRSDFAAFVATSQGQRHYQQFGDYYGRSNMTWYGNEDGFAGIIHDLEHGSPELRETLLKMMDGVELDLPHFPSLTMTRRRKRRWMDEGDHYEQERTWSGDLEHAWNKAVRTERLQPNTKRVTLAFDVADNCGVRNEQAMWRAALSLLLCDSLARAGRVFEVWAIDSTSNSFKNGPRNYYGGWLVKPTNDPAILDHLAVCLSIGYFRSVGFMSRGQSGYACHSTLGYASHSGLPHTLHTRREGGEVVIRIAGCYSKQDAIARYAEAWREVERCAGAEPDESSLELTG